jgi:hypothetical protein
VTSRRWIDHLLERLCGRAYNLASPREGLPGAARRYRGVGAAQARRAGDMNGGKGDTRASISTSPGQNFDSGAGQATHGLIATGGCALNLTGRPDTAGVWMPGKRFVANTAQTDDSARPNLAASQPTHSWYADRGQKRQAKEQIARAGRSAGKNARQPSYPSLTPHPAGSATQSGDGYLFDFFISYKRDAETRSWIDRHFRPLLTLRVRQELRREPKIFIDDQLEAGLSWPAQLGNQLGRSRILIALWSKDYFSSDWCVREMSHMLDRHRRSSKRSTGASGGLVIPVVIHDGDDFPSSLDHIQRIDIQGCFNVRMAVDSRRAEDLDAILAREAHAFAKAVERAPTWQERWPTRAAAEFYDQHFRSVPVEQLRLPRFTD